MKGGSTPHRGFVRHRPAVRRRQPSQAVAAALEQPGLRLPQIVQTVIDGYADRPALGQRAVEFVTDPPTGRTSLELLPRFETITYRELANASTLRAP